MAKQPIDIQTLSKKNWLTVNELAAYLSLSVHTIRERVENDSLPYKRIPGSHLLRFRRENIDQWLEGESVDGST